MTLNLDKYKDDVVRAWKEVMDLKNPTNWALFGYEAQTFDLKLVGKGAGGLEELIEDFNSGKIMYALCRVKVEERNMEKVVLINWQGEGAPLARKGTCANHFSTIKQFFKGVSVTLSARTDEDVEPEVILQAVTKAIAGDGLRMCSNPESISDGFTPVGTTYKRVNPNEEINSRDKDEFWKKEGQEEENRRRSEEPKFRKFSQDEVKVLRRESLDYFQSTGGDQSAGPTSLTSNTSSASTPSPSPSPLPSKWSNGVTGGSSTKRSSSGGEPCSPSPISSPPPTFTNYFIAGSKAEALRASAPRKSSSSSGENLVRQRIKSFDGGASGPLLPNGKGQGTLSNTEPQVLSVNTRKVLFENGGTASSMSSGGGGGPRPSPAQEIQQLRATGGSGLGSVHDPTPPATPVLNPTQAQQLHSNSTLYINTKNSPSPEPPKSLKSPPLKCNNTLPMFTKGSVSSKLAERVNRNTEGDLVSVTTTHVVPPPEPTSKVNSGTLDQRPNKGLGVELLSDGVPCRQDSSPPRPQASVLPNKIPGINGSPQVSVPDIIQTSIPPPVQNAPDVHPPQFQEDQTVKSGEEPLSPSLEDQSPLPEINPEMGTCARALYDYQAADETEITFDPGDIITNIEKIDEGWWEGLGPGQTYGLFPANYVELLN